MTLKIRIISKKPNYLILNLPESVASSAMYILSGQLPVEAEIHKRRLTLYWDIVRKECVEKDMSPTKYYKMI